MEPLVNPWLFYFVHVADGIKALAVLAGAFCILIGSICVLAYADDCSTTGEYDLKIGKRILLFGIISLVVSVFIPNENTIYKMIAAYLVTPDNISTFENGTLEFVEKLAEAIARHIK